MKQLTLLACAASMLALTSYGQPGSGMGMGPSPKFSSSTEKLFGDHKAFTAKLEMTAKGKKADESIVMPGTMSFDDGKSRFEMDLAQAKGGAMNPEALPQMKAMGMDKMVMISRPDLKVNYMIYPGMKAFVEMSSPAPTKEDKDKTKVDLVELGKEEVDGHACVKSKAVITEADGKKHEALVWKAADLKDFPVKIEQAEEGTQVTLLFRDVSLKKPEAEVFAPAKDFKKYDSMQGLMQGEMMKRMGGQN